MSSGEHGGIANKEIRKGELLMFFLMLGDLFAVWLLPVLLALLAIPGVWLALYLCMMPVLPNLALTGFLAWPITCIIWCIARSMAVRTPHLRATPKALMTYSLRFVALLFLTQLIMVGSYCGLFWTFRVAGLMNGAYIILTGYLSLLLGGFIFQQLAVRSFLWTPLPEGERELVRGVDLQSSDDIERRAWRDE